MHQCLTKGLAILAASAMTLLRVYPASAQDKDGSSTKTPIKQVVVIFQENVSFDHYFLTYPHAKENNDGSKYFKGATCDEDHSYSDEQFAFDGGLMDRFAKVSCKDPNIGPFSTMGYFWGFRFPTISLRTFEPDNPAATSVIRSLVLLGARSDGGHESYECVLLWSAFSIRGARLGASSWPAGANTR